MKTNLKALFTRIMAFLLAAVLMCGTFTESASAATKNVINQNVSAKAASCNATAGSLPTAAKTLTGGSSYYFNFQVSSDLKVKKAQLYIKDVGSSSYENVDTETAKNYIRYAYIKYTVANKSGTLKYYWKLTYTSGKTKTTSAQSVTVNKSSVSISTNYTGTSSTTSSSYYALVNGTKLKAGTTFYTYTKSGSKYTKTTGGSGYYVKVGSSYVNVKAAQCLGFAHYIQYLLYGKYDGTTSTLNTGFTQIAKNKTTTSSNAKTYITQAGAGAHIRVYNKSYGTDHSLIVISTTSKGFYYVDANGTSGNNIVSVGYMTWSSFAKKYTKIYFIRYYAG